MDINWLADFTCLAQTLNFTRAAQERHITQSAFSRRIQSLENWLGVPLVQRNSYPIRLSKEGEQFLPVAQETLAKLVDIRQQLRMQERGRTAFQRFAVLHTLSINHLVHKIAELEKTIPNLHTRIYSRNLHSCCELLSNDVVDFLLCYHHAVIHPVFEKQRFLRKDIGTEQLIPVATADHAQNWTLEGTATAPIPWLGYDPDSFLGQVVDQIIGPRKPPLSLHYIDALTETLKRRMLAGSGIAWLPESVIAEELDSGIVRPVGGPTWTTSLTLTLFCSQKHLNAAGRALWAAL